MPQTIHRLAALCFADVVGYTRLSAADEDHALALTGVFQEVAGRAVEAHGGRVAKFLGDGVLAEFTSTGAAARAALELGERFAAEAEARGLGAREVRAGIHLGDILASDGELYGDGVNVASRIHAAAAPGQVLVSEDVWRQLRPRREFVFEPLGEREIEGLAAPLALYAVRLAGGARSAPAPAPRARPADAPARRSIAVLPFANMSASAENEYFSDGVTEEILNLLARVGGLKVISRTSVMRYKGTDKPIRRIGEELGVGTILEGSVRQAGQRVRITAQLIDTQDDEHLWAERYDRDLEDIFAIQSDVAERIVEALRVRLKPGERARLAERPTEDLAAHESYLKGRHFLNRRTEKNLRQAIAWFRKAVDADPGFAHAWAGLADAYALLPGYSSTPAREAGAEARAAAGRALELDPGLGAAHAALGLVAERDWNWEEAEREFRRAIALDPGSATAYHWYGLSLSVQGRTKEALAVLERALELDPLSLPVHTAMAVALEVEDRFEEAIEVYRKAIDLDPSYAPAHNNLAYVHLHLRRYEEFLEEWETLSRLAPDWPSDLVAEVRRGYEAGGERGLWEAYLEGIRARPARQGSASDAALACAQLGRIDEAFAIVEKMLAERDAFALQVVTDALFDPLRADPRYGKVLERLGLG